jgi:DNA-binding NarL/FixJ family response regulator
MPVDVLIFSSPDEARNELLGLLSGLTDVNSFGSSECQDLEPAGDTRILLLDLRNPTDHTADISECVESIGESRVVVIGSVSNEAEVWGLLQSGISGYILPFRLAEDLPRAIAAAKQGQHFLSPGITDLVIDSWLTARSDGSLN